METVAVNPETNTVYAALSDSVDVVDGTTRNLVTTIPIANQAEPILFAINPKTNRIYTQNFDGTISVIDGSTNIVSATIPYDGFGNVTDIAVNPETNTLYVAHWNSNVIVIDGATNTVKATGPETHIASGIAVNAVNNTVYVSRQLDYLLDEIDGGSNTLTEQIALGGRLFEITFNPGEQPSLSSSGRL